MRRMRCMVAAALCSAVLVGRAEALPMSISIDTCAQGDCASFDASGRGSIEAVLDVVNGNDLLITLTNSLNNLADGDDPFLTSLGFEYGDRLSGLTFDSFTVLSGTVAQPTFSVDTSIKSFFLDFGFSFSDAGSVTRREGRFQASDPDEIVQILVGTTGAIDLKQFALGVAKVGDTGVNGSGDYVVLTGHNPAAVPEPGTLATVLLGLGLLRVRRASRRQS